MKKISREERGARPEAVLPRQFAPDGTPYPPMEILPSTTYMTPCEVLCWIAYRRPISKWLFFGPLEWEMGLSVSGLEQSLHDAIPQPRPFENPVPRAQATLIEHLRKGRLRAFDEEKPGMPVISQETFRHAVTITCRGFLEADEGDSQRDWDRGREILDGRSPAIVFLTEEVRACFPTRSGDENDGRTRARDFILSELEKTPNCLKRMETIAACRASTGVTHKVARQAFTDAMPTERRLTRGKKK